MGRLKKQGNAVWEVLLVMLNVQVSVFAFRQVIFTCLLEKGVFHSSASAVQPQCFLAVCGLIPAAPGLAPAQNHAADPVAPSEKWFQCGLRNLQFEKSPVERGHAQFSRGLGEPRLQIRCVTAPVPPVGAQLLFERCHYPPGALCPLRHRERLVPPQGWGNGKGKLLLSSNFSNHVIFHSEVVWFMHFFSLHVSFHLIS